jgi:hypothetical protein
MATCAGHVRCTLFEQAHGRICLRSWRVPSLRPRTAHVHHVSSGVCPTGPVGGNHQPTCIVNPGRDATGDPPIRLMHVHLLSDRQTPRAVCGAYGLHPGAPRRPGSVKVRQLPEIAPDEVLPGHVPHPTKSQRGRSVNWQLAALLGDVGSCADDHQLTTGHHLAQNARDLEPRHLLTCGAVPLLLHHDVVGPLEPAVHVCDLRQHRSHRHSAQQRNPTEVCGTVGRYRNHRGHGDRGTCWRLPLTGQPAATSTLVVGHHNPPRTGVSQRLQIC